jgi:polar amino acid transport system substrate-binding protein
MLGIKAVATKALLEGLVLRPFTASRESKFLLDWSAHRGLQMKQKILAALMLLFAMSALADGHIITVSSNNTPLDRKVLLGVSEEAFQRTGNKFKLINLPSERSLVAANAGEIDGEGLRVAGLSGKYPNLIQVPEAYIGISFVAFAKDATIKLGSWDDLKNYRVAFINGWKMFEKNASIARIVNKVDKPEQMFEMLLQDRVDLVLYTLADGNVYLKKNSLTQIAPLKPALKDVDLYLYLHRKHEQLVPKLNQAIQAMKADGSYNQIISRALTP